MSDPQPMLSLRDFSVSFDTARGPLYAVRNVDIDVADGESLGIVGESGSGKSVTCYSLLGLIPQPPGRIESGEAIFDNTDLLKCSTAELNRIRGKRIAMIFQDPMTSLNPVLSVARQLTESLQLHLNMDGSQSKRRAIELLDLVGIPSAKARVDDYPHQFSGGMRQRVMIAMALSCNPRLLIADEPTTALDVTIQAQILDLIRNLAKDFNTATILITHDLGVVAGMCDDVMVMYAGRVAERANALSVFGDPSHPYTMGLLRSVPRLDQTERERLLPIEGLPPDLIELPDNCPFHPRCGFATEKCRSTRPTLHAPANDGHEVACWHPRGVVASD